MQGLRLDIMQVYVQIRWSCSGQQDKLESMMLQPKMQGKSFTQARGIQNSLVPYSTHYTFITQIHGWVKVIVMEC